MTARLTITFAGPHVSIQDRGRPGLARFGVPQSGPMDRTAFAAAHAALGNPANTAAIEVSLGGLTLTNHDTPVTFAVTGGGFIVDHAGRKSGAWQTATLSPGQTLILRPGPWGAWTYLAFAGEITAPGWLHSKATHSQSGLGGGKLTTDQTLEITNPRQHPARTIPCPTFARPASEIRATLGPQDRFFTADQIEALQTAIWKLTPAYDRMGVRLSGPKLIPEGPLDMPSEPVAKGSIQVAGDGVATVLLADHQTTGGYPKLATVLDADLDRFAQLRPGDAFRLRLVTPDQATTHARLMARTRARWLASLTI